jgi:outer membrane protein assembly factor BamB
MMAGQGCKKPEPIKYVSSFEGFPYPTNLEVLWSDPFYSDSSSSYYTDPVFAGKYLVLANASSDAGHSVQVRVFDRFTGKRHSAWSNDNNELIESYEGLQTCKITGKNKDIICIYGGRSNLYAYRLTTGQQLWKTKIPLDAISQISVSDIYAFVSYGSDNGSWSQLIAVDVESGNKTDILKLYTEDNYKFQINPPSAHVTSQGDTMLFFTTSGWNFDEVKGRVHAYCYNLTKKQMEWINKNFTNDKDATAKQQPPFVIENDKLIVTSMSAIHCFDVNTGELIWQQEGLDFVDKPYLYQQGKLYIRSGDPCILSCYDAQTGRKLWKNTTLNPIPAPWGSMGIYKDKLYFTAWGKNAWIGLFCVDANNGNLLWQDAGPTGRVSYAVLIDQDRGYMYCQSGWSVMCVDLNKTPNGKGVVK